MNWLMLLLDTAIQCFACLQVIELPIKHPELFESLGVAQPKVGAALQLYTHFLDTHATFARCFPAAGLLRIAPNMSVPELAANKLVQDISAWLLPSLGHMITLPMT